MTRDSVDIAHHIEGSSESLLHGEYASRKWMRQDSPDDNEKIPIKRRETRKFYQKTAIFGCIVSIVIYIIATIPLVVPYLKSFSLHSCGNSIEEAITRGCIFDPLTVTWLPKHCSREGVDEFLVSNNNQSWRYYTDSDGSTELLDLSPRLGERTYWTTKGEHLTHCAYILIRSAFAHENKERLDHTSGSLHHTKHCALFLLEAAQFAPDFEEINTAGNVKLGAC